MNLNFKYFLVLMAAAVFISEVTIGNSHEGTSKRKERTLDSWNKYALELGGAFSSAVQEKKVPEDINGIGKRIWEALSPDNKAQIDRLAKSYNEMGQYARNKEELVRLLGDANSDKLFSEELKAIEAYRKAVNEKIQEIKRIVMAKAFPGAKFTFGEANSMVWQGKRYLFFLDSEGQISIRALHWNIDIPASAGLNGQSSYPNGISRETKIEPLGLDCSLELDLVQRSQQISIGLVREIGRAVTKSSDISFLIETYLKDNLVDYSPGLIDTATQRQLKTAGDRLWSTRR